MAYLVQLASKLGDGVPGEWIERVKQVVSDLTNSRRGCAGWEKVIGQRAQIGRNFPPLADTIDGRGFLSV